MAKIEREGAVDLMTRIGGAMSGAPVPEAARPAIGEPAGNEQRVVLRVSPRTFVT